VISHGQNHVAGARRGVCRRRYWKAVGLKAQDGDIGGRIAPNEGRLDDATAGERKFDVFVSFQNLFRGNDDAGTPVDSTRRPSAAAMDGDNAACGAFNELRGAVRERSKGIGGLGHGKFSGGCLHGRDLALAKTRRYWPDGQVAAIAPPVSSQASSAAARVTLVADANSIRCDAKNAAGIWSRTSPPRTAGAMIEGRTPDGNP
jgi:hypothetical protein